MPVNRSRVKLGTVARIYDGTHQTPKYVDRGIPFYSVEQITSNDFNHTKYISEDVFEKESKRVRIEQGDILMTRIGDIGTARYIDWDVRASFYVSVALLKCSGRVSPRYIAYAIGASEFQKELRKRSLLVAFPYKINLGDIGRCTISIPTKEEQVRIVDILETWDSYIELLGKRIALKGLLKKHLIQQLMTGNKRIPGFTDEWTYTTIGKIGRVISGGTPDTTKIEYWNGEINWITPSEITKVGRKIVSPTEKRITEEGQRSSAATIVPANSIILCSRATIGACAVNTYPITTNQGFKNIVPNDSVSVWFLYYWIKNNQKTLLRISSGSTFLEFSKKDFEKIKITLPSIEEQQAIANVLNTVDDEIELLHILNQTLCQQKKYLLENLISGEVRAPETAGIAARKDTIHA